MDFIKQNLSLIVVVTVVIINIILCSIILNILLSKKECFIENIENFDIINGIESACDNSLNTNISWFENPNATPIDTVSNISTKLYNKLEEYKKLYNTRCIKSNTTNTYAKDLITKIHTKFRQSLQNTQVSTDVLRKYQLIQDYFLFVKPDLDFINYFNSQTGKIPLQSLRKNASENLIIPATPTKNPLVVIQNGVLKL